MFLRASMPCSSEQVVADIISATKQLAFIALYRTYRSPGSYPISRNGARPILEAVASVFMIAGKFSSYVRFGRVVKTPVRHLFVIPAQFPARCLREASQSSTLERFSFLRQFPSRAGWRPRRHQLRRRGIPDAPERAFRELSFPADWKPDP